MAIQLRWRYTPQANMAEATALAAIIGPRGPQGVQGDAGAGVPNGGTTGQILAKQSNDDLDTEWVDPSASSAVDVVSNVATSTILGRVTAGSGDSEELTAAQVRTLLNVEDGATADQTGAEIKAAYEAEADTNAFTDVEKAKLSGIEAGADVTDTANVTAAGALMDSEVANLADVKAFDPADHATAAQGSNADTAYSWGDHASAGYAALASANTFTETNTFNGSSVFSGVAYFDGPISSDPLQKGVHIGVGGNSQIALVGDGATNNQPHIDFSAGSGVDYSARIIYTSSTHLDIQGIGATAFKVGGQTVWTAGNDGTGSGLDADLLDGQHASAFATATQGALADSAVQPGDDAATLGSGAAADGHVLMADGAGGAAWEALAGGGDLLSTNNLSDVADAATARTNLGVQIGVDVQAYDADTAKTDVQQTFTAAQGTTITALTSGATVNTDASLSNAFSLTLDTNATLANPTNIVAGRTYVWIITQDGTGSRTLAYGSHFKWPGGTAPTLSTAAGSVDVIIAFAASATSLLASLNANYS